MITYNPIKARKELKELLQKDEISNADDFVNSRSLNEILDLLNQNTIERMLIMPNQIKAFNNIQGAWTLGVNKILKEAYADIALDFQKELYGPNPLLKLIK